MKVVTVWFFIALLSLHNRKVHGETIDLSQAQWIFWSKNGSIKGKAKVPGNIYTDLLNNNIIEEPLFENNDIELRWVASTNWVYQCHFTVPKRWLNYTAVILKIDGLDTVANVWVNNQLTLKSYNQFLPYLIELEVWRPGSNNLTIEFESPVNYAEKQAMFYHFSHFHEVPPNCPPHVYHGQCHVNFIRKIQSSFGWDWGPSFPTVGIWQPLLIEGFNTLYINRVSAKVKKVRENFVITAEMTVFSTSEDFAQLSLSIPELHLFGSSRVHLKSMQINYVTSNFEIPVNVVELWWPNGYGQQRLYTLNLHLNVKDAYFPASPLKLGFRTVELDQSYVDSSQSDKGRNFYFKVNGVPIFLKGTNWIPLSAFPANNHTERLYFLFDSIVEANMNTMRVWGGGRYETDEFYALADQKGIMLWHDLMFACALYPTDTSFLLNVRNEVVEQVRRLRHHPSILLWSGNNENEFGLTNGWFFALNYHYDEMLHDYMKLYNNTIGAIISALDDTRPYILSSPSNGIESEIAGGVSKNPNDQKYGDIHYYSDFKDLWKDYNYLIPRCATEYGVQSLPARETMLHWLNETNWSLLSKSFLNRQHRPGGVFSLLTDVYSHFKLPVGCDSVNSVHQCLAAASQEFLSRFTYYTQVHQAIAYQVQTEHYRRWRGRLAEDGLGNTMCALYWQLNDIWSAPSWSSIDFDLIWKPLHYAAKRFFAPVIVSTFLNPKRNLQVFVVSDHLSALERHVVTLDMFAWTAGFSPVYTEQITITIPPNASTQIIFPNLNSAISRIVKNGETDYIIRVRLSSPTGAQIGYDSILLPDRLFKTSEFVFGNVKVDSIQQIDSLHYTVKISADALAPIVWLKITRHARFWFSDNAFTMTESEKSLNLTLWEAIYPPLLKKDIRVCSLKDCGLDS